MGQDHSSKKANNRGRGDGAPVSFEELSEPGSFGKEWGPVHCIVLHLTEVAANDHGNGKDAKPENWNDTVGGLPSPDLSLLDRKVGRGLFVFGNGLNIERRFALPAFPRRNSHSAEITVPLGLGVPQIS
jgi:hypothetical protein